MKVKPITLATILGNLELWSGTAFEKVEPRSLNFVEGQRCKLGLQEGLAFFSGPVALSDYFEIELALATNMDVVHHFYRNGSRFFYQIEERKEDGACPSPQFDGDVKEFKSYVEARAFRPDEQSQLLGALFGERDVEAVR